MMQDEGRLQQLVREVARLIRFYAYPVPYLARNYLRFVASTFSNINLPNGVCLDVGSGTAPYKETIMRAFPIQQYIAVDIAPSNATSVIADAEKLPFRDKSISLVVSMDVLQHIPDHLCVLDEIYRVLAPGGMLIISFPFLYGECDFADYRRWSISGMEKDLNQRGFEVINSRRRGGLFFAAASGVHLAAQLIIPGGRKSWRASVTFKNIARSTFVVAITIPTAIFSWLALVIDSSVNPESLSGYYMGAFIACKRPV